MKRVRCVEVVSGYECVVGVGVELPVLFWIFICGVSIWSDMLAGGEMLIIIRRHAN